jgi:hypothetical protein
MAPFICPACRARNTARGLRCAACQVALGEDNRCGRCLAIAPVFERAGRCVCSACGETRARHADTLVTTEAELLQAFDPRRGSGLPRLLLGLSALSLLLVAWLWAQGTLPRDNAILVGTVVLGMSVWLQRLARRRQARVRARRRYEIEQRIIGLAYRNDGLLTPSAVSTTLRISHSEAQELLGELASSARARAEPAADGSETTYLFGEAKRTRGLRGRASSP